MPPSPAPATTDNDDPQDMTYEDKLEAAEKEVQELRSILGTERGLVRQWREVALKAQKVMQEAHLDVDLEMPEPSSSTTIGGGTNIEPQQAAAAGGLGIPLFAVTSPPRSSRDLQAAAAKAGGGSGRLQGSPANHPFIQTPPTSLRIPTTIRSGDDLKRMMGVSIIREVGVNQHFKNLAASLNESRRHITSTNVVLKDVTLSFTVAPETKAFPTVAEAIVDPIVGLCRRGGNTTFEVKALRNVTTVLEPSKMYLIIGGPKSGKTSFLKTVAGRRIRGKGVKLAGSVTYNGEKADGQKGFDMTSLACYVEETDNNEPLLTVRETLHFSGACILPVPTKRLMETDYFKALVASLSLEESDKQQLLAGKNTGHIKVRQALAKQRANVVMTLLGLNGCADTIIGDATIRGVSGGERRRVTLAEVLMGEYSVACFDEISNGLDSAATFDITKMARASAHAFKYTCVIALNQPSPEVFGLFDEVLVLKKGGLVFQGSPQDAQAHFESLGFRCPPKTDVADFLIQVTGPKETARKLRASMAEGIWGEGGTGSSFGSLGSSNAGSSSNSILDMLHTPRTTADFMQRFEASGHGQALLLSAKEACPAVITTSLTATGGAAATAAPAGNKGKWREHERRKYNNTWWSDFRICLQREIALTMRDRSYIISRVLQDLFLGFLTGFIFFNLQLEAVATRYGALYQSLLTIAFQTAACIPAYFTRRRVFYKQKNSGFFRCSSYLLASTAAAVPLVLLDSVLFGVVVYWATGFAREDHGAHFFVFMAHLTVLGWCTMVFFKLCTFLSPDLTSAAGLSGIVMFFLLLFSGFIISIQNVPSYYKWIVYLNPIYYSFQGLCVNEFVSDKYSKLAPGTTQTLGEIVLQQKGLYTDSRWTWWGLLANLGITFFYLVLTQWAMQVLEWVEPVCNADTTPEEAITNGSFAMRQPGSVRRQHLLTEGEQTSVCSSVHGGGLSTRSLPSTILEGDEETKEEEEEEQRKSSLVVGLEGGEMEMVDVDIEAGGGTGSGGGGSGNGGGPAAPRHARFASQDEADESSPSVPTKLVSTTKFLSQIKKGMSSTWQLEAVKAIPFVPTTLTFKDLWYSVPVKGNETVDLLKGVNGFVTPGTMMALMGSSGAGKTTLLDVLAGRKTGGSIRGSILVNSVDVGADVFKSLSAYVEQFGSVSPYMTVKEVLEFNADLRLPSDVDAGKRQQLVEDVLKLLELDNIATSVVGPPGAGLSFEELKRVTIGAEVVANPSLLFLDEPTTGLDARAAMIVIRVMRKLAQTGRSIICTIHQPSLEIFNNFDSLLLLRRGGETVFCGNLGPGSAHLIDYFEAVPGVDKLLAGENPASWMLDCLGAGTGLGVTQVADYVAEWNNSALCIQNLETLATLTEPPTEAQLETMARVRTRERASFGKQLVTCIKRAWRSMWRMPEYQLARVGGVGVMGLILGSLYHNQTQDDVAGLGSFIALLFLATTCVANINSTAVLQVVALEKTSFCQERFNRMFQVSAYTLSWFLCEIPWVALQTLVYTLTFYPTCNYNMEGWRICWFYAFSFMYMLFSTCFGQAIGAICPSVQVAQVVLGCLVPIFSMMSGMTIIPADLQVGWKFLWILTPMNKAFEGMVVTQWGLDNDGAIKFLSIRNKRFEVLTRWQFVEEYFGTFKFEHRWRDFGALFGFILVCNLAYYLALKYRKLENR